ncbi:PC3-like endoprotease variant B [Amphiura filiformis]|uniref:PC3-like endoprotease variant B n=1 Tax=Amphiura filiformis TaxID=82378 RepID=UPI003B2243F1
MKQLISRTLFSLLVCYLVVQCQSAKKDDKIYVKEWALKIEGGERVARDVAEEHGFRFVRQIGTLKDMYLVRHEDGKRTKRRADITEFLENDPRVQWVQQQHLNELHKRDFRALPDDVLPADATGADDKPLKFTDPLFPKQWYLFNQAQNGATKGIDMNTMPAWKLGITGYGVVVSIIDDGVDPTHPDLAPNFDMAASHDFQNETHDNDPNPHPDDSVEAGTTNEHTHPHPHHPTLIYTPTQTHVMAASHDFQNETHDNDPNPHPDDSVEAGTTNDHGTKCAGEVAAAANNSVCGVGVAYDASIGGMRVLDGPVTDAMEASALTFNNQHIDVYSCCWGPPDDGDNFRGPHPLTAAALETGVKEGRGGKGSIFVWASGNGGVKDDCSGDGYVSNIRSISIGAINDEGLSAYFMESCPSTMGVVISGGPHYDRKKRSTDNTMRGRDGTLNLVVTTDLHHKCTERFVGTSASAPLASGVMALILQANPELTWRDVQHIVAEGAMIPNVEQDGWHINGAGFHVNPMFGFGVLDAGKMVELALTWEMVSEQLTCEVPMKKFNIKVPMGESRNATMKIKCSHIAKLEHTIASISFEAPRRGDVSIRLISPSGTPSQLLSTRPKDHTDEGLEDWPFMTVHNWGETVTGEWTLELTNNMPSEEVLEDFLNHEGDSKDDDEDDDEGEFLELVPRLTKAAVLVKWGFTFYGTGPEKGSKGKPDEPEDDNPAINPELTGPADQETIKDVWNDEQADDEEINVDPEDLAKGANIPPNIEHNFEDGEIDTGAFDGHVANDDILSLTNGEKMALLRYLLKMESREFEEKLREIELQEEYEKVRDAVSSYKKDADMEKMKDEQRRYHKEDEGNEGDRRHVKEDEGDKRHVMEDEGNEGDRRNLDEGKLHLENLSREEVLMLLDVLKKYDSKYK